MPQRLKTALAVLASFAFAGGLLYLAFRGVDFSSVGNALRTASYGWVVPLVVVSILAHLLRAWRWQMLMEALPDLAGNPSERISLRLAFYSVMIGYMVNYATPRLGEFVRAANVASRSSLRFAGVLGTIVVERIVDLIALVTALLIVVVVFRSRLNAIGSLLWTNLSETVASTSPAMRWSLVVAVLIVIAGGIYVLRAIQKSRGEDFTEGGGRLIGIIRSFRDGLFSLFRVRQRVGVTLTTVGIWSCYVLMADIPLRMLGLTRQYSLGLADSLALMSVGAIGMSFPSPGGTGSFHYITVQTLLHLFSMPETTAATYAIVAHAAQLILVCVVGFICVIVQGTSFRALRENASAGMEEAHSAA